MTCGFALVHDAHAIRSAEIGESGEAPERWQGSVRSPLHGPYEVSQLALTLDELARRVQIRDRELRERAARYETILRAAGEGIVICSANGDHRGGE